ncbi:hypothetical protein NQ318_007791 [Aromia moschata]|uniref:Uncharacterized protein n=1 Tax=Aromia moschata TaxID=1265417 RepID=A0AAV8Z098_9CUCU|nr:hypothetical protein NQ318_007791 [Aromia moschata]
MFSEARKELSLSLFGSTLQELNHISSKTKAIRLQIVKV